MARRLLGWIAVLLAAAGCRTGEPERVKAPADPAAGEVPIRLLGPGDAALVVPVHINGRGPYDFVFDTGATLTCVDSGLAERLRLPDEPLGVGIGIGVGGTGQVRIVRIDSLRIGAASAHELPGCVIDLGHVEIMGDEIHGLVGLNFMKPFRVTVDFDREVLRLEP